MSTKLLPEFPLGFELTYAPEVDRAIRRVRQVRREQLRMLELHFLTLMVLCSPQLAII